MTGSFVGSVLILRYRTGVPQIVMAQWHDTYEYAAKIEYLGIGVYGNKSCAPDLDGQEFEVAATKCVGINEISRKIQERANELGRLCQRNIGTEVAVEKIISLLVKETTT